MMRITAALMVLLYAWPLALARCESPVLTVESASDTAVQLRLSNTSSDVITLELAAPAPEREYVLGNDGTFGQQEIHAGRDGIVVNIMYSVFDERIDNALVARTDAGCLRYTYDLHPGRSVLFEIPAADLREGTTLGIDFACGATDSSPGSGEAVTPRSVLVPTKQLL